MAVQQLMVLVYCIYKKILVLYILVRNSFSLKVVVAKKGFCLISLRPPDNFPVGQWEWVLKVYETRLFILKGIGGLGNPK